MNSTPTHTIIVWSEKARPGRMCATSHPTSAANTMARPPIVGVPCLCMWWSGP